MTARADQSASHKISDRARLSPAALAAGGVGNLLEWYDFGLYGYFAPVLARLFFPSDDPLRTALRASAVGDADGRRHNRDRAAANL
jgi:MFS transporter, MHS family, proline/betaine transporter